MLQPQDSHFENLNFGSSDFFSNQQNLNSLDEVNSDFEKTESILGGKIGCQMLKIFQIHLQCHHRVRILLEEEEAQIWKKYLD